MGSWGCIVLSFLLLATGCGRPQTSPKNITPILVNPTLPVKQSTLTSPKLLFIGDSLASNTAFAKNLVSEFNALQATCKNADLEFKDVYSYALPSSSPRHYIATSGTNKNWLCKQKKIYRNGTGPDLTGSKICENTQGLSVFEKLIDQHKPTHFLIALGTNSLGFSADYIVNRVTEMLEALPQESQCYWVPPTYVSAKYQAKAKKVEKAIVEAIEAGPSDCQIISTYHAMENQKECTRFNVSDGIHHTRCGSALWAEEVFEQICSEL